MLAMREKLTESVVFFFSPIPDPTDQPMQAHDLGIWLPLGPPNGRAPTALATPVILVIVVCLNCKYTPRLKEFQSGNRP